ncbi:hypothetical protein [Haloarcula litorea]|uniref:hypothetical protein n=1 Tax=Haloarcula litorea TaxID=3032579 RepID=UPI0023E8BCB7|nr:hypothetical protein [Halomicroarcula sp. GDY20]
MDPATKSSLLWGVVGALSFLVLVQGYELFAGVGVAVTAKAGVALAVGAAAALLTHVARDRLPGNESP